MTEPSTQSKTEGEKETIVVVGKESVGKSALVAGLAGTTPTTGNFRGTTVDVERYDSPEYVFVDTPGILLDADTETTRTAIEAVDGSETVLLVVRATNIDSDLEDLLPLVQGKVGAVAVTFWDKVENQADAREQLDALAGEVGVPVVPVDARTVTPAVTDGGDAVPNETDYNRLHRAIDDADRFPGQAPQGTGISLEPPTTILEHTLLGPVLSIALLLLPAAVAVHFANAAAAALSPRVGTLLEPAVPMGERASGAARSGAWRRLRPALDGSVSVRLGRPDDSHLRTVHGCLQTEWTRNPHHRVTASTPSTRGSHRTGPRPSRDGLWL